MYRGCAAAVSLSARRYSSSGLAPAAVQQYSGVAVQQYGSTAVQVQTLLGVVFLLGTVCAGALVVISRHGLHICIVTAGVMSFVGKLAVLQCYDAAKFESVSTAPPLLLCIRQQSLTAVGAFGIVTQHSVAGAAAAARWPMRNPVCFP